MAIDRLTSPPGSNDNRPGSRSGWVFRKLRPHDSAVLSAHLLRLDREQRGFRFGRAVADEWVAHYALSTDWTRSVVLGCWIAGELRGVGEIKMLDELGPLPAAEAALSVERPFESRGLGTALFQRALLIARNRGIKHLTMLCLPENERVQRIIRKVRPTLALGRGQIECWIDLEAANALSIAAELYDDGCALTLSLLEGLAPAA
ncbi:MAG TPA: GNAT family N-acetyltransferase [Stellaceae bacterium]|nr:GNAT family N-acetyltransferase [Stellaceae bacterium]